MNIKIHRAELVLSDCLVSAADDVGGQMVISQIVDPNTFGSWHANDYSVARHGNHCTAQTITHNADNLIYKLDNRQLLNNLERVINLQNHPAARIHLVARNNEDFSGATQGGNNIIRFDDVDDNAPLKIRVYFGVRASRKHMRGGGGRSSKAGFQGINIAAGTSGGFS